MNALTSNTGAFPEQTNHTLAHAQRTLNTLENQDHLLIQSLFTVDQEIRLDEDKAVTMKRVGDSYDRAGSSRRVQYQLLKDMVEK